MFWKRKSKPDPVVRGSFAIPAGQRVYAIGDIHGRDDLFAELVDLIRADNKACSPARVTLILLGDLVDRGPQSAEVVERAIRLRDEFQDLRLLIGNHEECFLAALTGDVRRLRYFMRIGGDATVHSYWKGDVSLSSASFEEVAERLPAMVPAAHVDFLGQGEDMITIGDYVFVHAGIRPGVALERQALADLRWIREDFLADERDHGMMIVHGHTIRDEVDEWPNRIGIDTGAYQSGVLTAIVLEGTVRRFLKTRGVSEPGGAGPSVDASSFD
ncbi:metallophosphoesterase family protein [Sphingopyxis sp. MWB1]|uniref:metallophosphoesterase family protein n=1 Tax=Sphingopyxis sp. MWB1 TaxID=1537715 RepID=UPI0006914E8A|nr:metallophosphoesterase family protein [Sphingopyxis sp. MWB1]